MALVDIPGGLWIPRFRHKNTPPALTSNQISLDGHQIEMIIQIPKTGNISKVEFRVATTTTGGDIEIRLEGVDLTDGKADGTLINVNAKGALTLIGADDDKWFAVVLDAAIAVTQGDYVAVVILNTATPAVVNIDEQADAAWDQDAPYTVDRFGSKDDSAPIVGLEYDDGSYPQILGCVPFKYTDEVWDSADTPDERALRFKVPFAARMGAFGATVAWQSPTLSVIDFVLYDPSDTVLFTLTPDREVNLSEGARQPRFFRLPTAIQIDADTFYRLAVKPTTNEASWRIQSVRAAASMDLIDGGQDFHLSTREDAGSWTDDLTQRPMLYIMFDQFDAAPSMGGNPLSLTGGSTGGLQ